MHICHSDLFQFFIIFYRKHRGEIGEFSTDFERYNNTADSSLFEMMYTIYLLFLSIAQKYLKPFVILVFLSVY